MSVNKFGMSLTNRGSGDGVDGASTVRLRSSIESLRNYARNNALFMSEDFYDAREHKIRRVAAPEIDTDATNRSYVEDAIEQSKKSATEELNGRIVAVEDKAEDQHKIRHVAAPENGTDAANKTYVDSAIGRLKKVVTDR
ncbi:hypothetical protein DBV15_11882 [Temnothorax longispinosus]|uniref:Uncharacterized protein n=1 Tax=Temnothorax longispinosus TaxID=300112 RepID=A0A4S2KRL2_9HYME|nr:hypothetical protein DBV15_11882 [Temnothorax longispinosus]